jgi:hypothetical protein
MRNLMSEIREVSGKTRYEHGPEIFHTAKLQYPLYVEV